MVMKSKKDYESVVIINAALDDEVIEATISKIQDFIKNNGGEKTSTERWGRKRLAYPIRKSKSGYYIIFRFFAPTEIITNLERMYRLDETIIRYLTVILEKAALDFLAKQAEKAANEEKEKENKVVEEISDTNQKSEVKNK